MSTTGASDLLLAPDVTFDVERFDWTAEDRLEVVGRWSGVRGLRFVRPVLTVPVAGQRRRIVALLEHKPWVASEGDTWVAAFPWEGHREVVGPAQLAVGPSLVVDLPAPGPREAPASREPSPTEVALRRAEEAEARAAREAEAALALLRREREEHERRRRELEADADALREDVAAARAVADELRLELAGARARLDDAIAAAARTQDGVAARLTAQLEAERERVVDLERRVAEAATARRKPARLTAPPPAAEEPAGAATEPAVPDPPPVVDEPAVAPDEEASAGLGGETPGAPAATLDEEPVAEPRLIDAPIGEDESPADQWGGAGAGREGRRTVKILDGPQRMPEVKPLLVQAAPLKRSAAATWGRRIAAIALLVAALIALVIILH
jgi:hypothetical protein